MSMLQVPNNINKYPNIIQTGITYKVGNMTLRGEICLILSNTRVTT
jgi:hypothetical protein